MKYARVIDNKISVIYTLQEVPLLKLADKNLYNITTVTEILKPGIIASEPTYTFKDTYVEEKIQVYTKTLSERKYELKERLKSIINNKTLTLYPEFEQRFAALGILPTNYTTTMKNKISALITQYNTYVGYINSADNIQLDNYELQINQWELEA